MNASLQRLARRHLSAMLARFPSSDAVPRPRDGWVAAIREALGMTGRQFAARLGVSPSGVTHLEARERNDTITLAALRRAAARRRQCSRRLLPWSCIDECSTGHGHGPVRIG